MAFWLRYIIYITVFIVSSCQNDHHSERAIDPSIESPHHQDPSDETLAMIDSVQNAQKAIDPMKVTVILSKERAAMFRQQSSVATGLQKANLMVQWGFEELKAGNNREAIKVFEDVLGFVAPLNIPGKSQTQLEVKKLLALAALRMGEQENCILNHTSASCVIPIAPAGQHEKPEGSLLAFNLYNEILHQVPEDLTSRYLMNIAAMTLGKFPDEVPSSFRLPPNYFTSSVEFPFFNDIAPQMGLDRRGLAGGIALEDFDRDGDIDIMHTSWGFHDQIQLHRNNGDGSFEDVALVSGLKGVTGGLNLRHADYNNDGYADVLVLRGAWLRDQGRIPNSLLKNNGDGTFTDVTLSAGLYSRMPTQTAVWADFDLDGWLDLFIGNESIPDGGAAFNFPSQLYHNQKDGTFKEVTRSSGLTVNSFVKGCTAGDVNNDGKEDLYISSLNTFNSLYINRSDATGLKFENVTGASGIAEPYVSFPTWMFDYNNDGWLDIFVSAYSDGSEDLPGKVLRAYGKKDDPFRPRLYRNNSNGSFTDVSSVTGLTEPAFTMGSNYGDLDNDGFPDFYLGTGEPNLKSVVPNKMYLNQAGKSFADITYAGGFGNVQKGHAAGFGDMDKDGDQDLYVVMGGSFEGDVYQNIFFENPLGQDNHWIILQLEGVQANRLALGAKVEIEIMENGSKRKIYEVVSTGSSFGGNTLQLEIGLGDADKIEHIKIEWPSARSIVDTFDNVEMDKKYFIKEGGSLEEVSYEKVPFKKEDAGQHHH